MEWSAYNPSLVRGGKILLGFDVIDKWNMERDEPRQVWFKSPFIILIPFFFYLDMPKDTFIFRIDKSKKLLLHSILKEKYPLFPTILQ
jgi:hypothetical protein